MARVGYIRVSTAEQNTDRQELGEVDRVFEDKVSGKNLDRPQLTKMLEYVREGDTIVCYSIDRLARSTAELLRISEVLNVKGAGIQSLDEPWADTTTPAGKMIMTVFGGIAEFERSLILSRTQEGREAAQARGVAFGRPGKLKSDQKNLARELVKEGQSISAVARTFNVHPATIYRCINEDQPL